MTVRKPTYNRETSTTRKGTTDVSQKIARLLKKEL